MPDSEDGRGSFETGSSRKDTSSKRRRKQREHSPSQRKRKRTSGKDSTKGQTYSSASSRIPDPIFGDDLLRAEREEVRRKEEREWKEKLNHLAFEDISGSEFGSRFPGGLNDVDEDDLAWEDEMQRHFSRKDKEREKEFDETVPKRWRTGPAPIRLEELDEEEYAEAIRKGMWKKTHGREVEEMEKAKAAREKAKAKEAKEKAERRALKKKKREEEIQRLEQEIMVKARENFHQRWKELREDLSNSQAPLFFSDLPWPTLPATSVKPLSLSKSSIEEFLFSNHSTEEGSELHRLALRLYHPDRFTSPSSWWKRVELGGSQSVETIKEASKRVSQSLAEIGRERKEKGKG